MNKTVIDIYRLRLDP